MLPIPGGSFIMGSPVTEVDRSTNEGPQHGVTLSPFSIGKFTVTQAQWLALMGSNPSSHTGDPTRPVEQVNYYDVTLAGGFLDKLNAATANTRPSGMVFRLPTEAEWEYAARGGTSTRFYWGDDPGYAQLSNCAWWNGNAQWNTWGNATGDLKPANPYGLYNMAGNVWEWCQDWQGDYPAAAQINPIGPATGVYRTCRGGDYSNYGSQLRVAYRSGATPDVKGVALGFRVVLAAPSGLSVSPSGLAYATNPAIYSKGVAIPANTPSNGGGSITSFQVSPALPAGLQLDGITGVITGTPSSASASSGYVVTGSNSAGSASATLVISVTEAGVLPPSGLAYSTNPCVYTVGVAIAPNIPTVGGGAVNAYSISPGLPSGLNMNPFTGVISGVPASYTPAATYFVLASNAIGSAMASLSIAVNDVPPSLTPIVTMATYVTAGKAGLVATTQDQGPGVNYIWAIWSGTITSGQGTRSITYTADASAGAQVTIQVRVMNSGGTRSGAAIGSIVAAPIADLTVQPTAPPGMTGLQASVTSQPGSTYLWTIVSGTSTGTITNGQGTNALVFSTSALVGTFQLSVIVQNQASDGATQLATITVAHGIWVATGNLVSGRSYHEATLLKNGNVLVTGGNIRFSTHAGPRQILNSAEQYDPIAGTWRGTGSMGIGRTWHSVSELQDGKVLVAGGTTPYLGGTVATATAEIWNPISGNWQSTGAMQSARSGHTATVLPNGKVLVTGGGSSTSEIYDPTTGTWSLSAGMVALPEGRAGGELLGIGHGSTTDEKFNNVIPPWLSVDDLMHSRILGSTNLIMKGMVPGVGAGSTSRERFDPDSIALTLFNPIGVSSPGESLTTFKDGRILRAGGTMLPPNLDWPISDASICYP
jgi:formylglycine-generating enzyme required for sulfatase activity